MHLRSLGTDFWQLGHDPNNLAMTVIVFDRFHRRRLIDASGLAHELPETHEPVRSPAPSDETSTEEVLLRLYCNTLDDEQGTPYHYEWIASEGSVPPVPSLPMPAWRQTKRKSHKCAGLVRGLCAEVVRMKVGTTPSHNLKWLCARGRTTFQGFMECTILRGTTFLGCAVFF